MNHSRLKYTLLPLFIFYFITGKTQDFSNSGINIGAKIGISRLLTETDFSQSFSEFNNHSGLSADFEVSKYMTPRWEIGAELDFSNLNGENDNPNFSANGWHAAFVTPITEPVEYTNKLNGLNFFFRYFIKPADTGSKFAPFVRAGIGYINYASEFKYKSPAEPTNNGIIFGKGVEDYLHLSTEVIKLGTGFKTSLSSQIYLLTNFDLNVVTYDFLDVVHNYDSEGNRLNLIGIYPEFKLGIFYSTKNLNFEKAKKRSRKKNHTSNKFLPFSR